MASLADIVNKNKAMVRGPGGQLSEETGEETQSLTGKATPLQTLSGQAGLQAPPISPLGAAAIGANPDQQKMVGTGQQKQAALSIAQSPDNTLSGAMRRNQVRSEATAEEQQGRAKSEDMKNLGSLGDRVSDFINTQRDKLEQAAGKGVDVQAAASFTGAGGQQKDLGQIKDLLQSYRQNPTDQNVLLKLNQALGYDVNTQLSKDQVDSLYESTVNSISRGAAGSVDDNLNVDDLVGMQGFGYDKNTLSNLLGVPVEQLGQMSVGDIRNKINEVAANEFAKTSQLDQQAQSGQLGQAERGLAHQQGMEASRTGQRTSEADVSHLEQQISNADQVTFAGQAYKVDDLLKDDNISSLISEYMNSAPDSDIRKQIDSTEKGLSDFIQKNQAVLQDASQQMQQGAQTFQETQAYNKSLQTVPFGGMKLDDNLAKLFIPGFGTLQATRTDVNSIPILKVAQDGGPEYGQTLARNLNDEIVKDHSMGYEIQGMDYDTLKSWDIGGGQDSAWNTSYIQPKRFNEAVQAASPEDRDALMKLAFSNVTNAGDVQAKLSANRASNVLGFGSSVNAGVADSNGDGVVDAGDTVRNALLSANPKPSLKSGPAAVKKYARTDLQEPTIPGPGIDGNVYNKLSGAAAKGQVTSDDLNSAGLSLDEAIRVRQLSGSGANIDQNGAQNIWSKLRDDSTSAGIQKAGNDVGALNALRNQDDDHVNKALIDSRISELTGIANEAAAASNREDERRNQAGTSAYNNILSGGMNALLPQEQQERLNRAEPVSTPLAGKLGGMSQSIGKNKFEMKPGSIGSGSSMKSNDDGSLDTDVGSTGLEKKVGGDGISTFRSMGVTPTGGGCFVAGTKFLLSNGSSKEVDKLTPYDTLLMGGRTMATAQFICEEMYYYQGVYVSGSHAVMEDGKWVRVRDSRNGERYEDLDGSIVYVVWNTGHRMVTEHGVVFSDYSETDSTMAEIEEQRNLDVLNREAHS